MEECIPTLTAKGWNTMGALAFATTYAPTQPNDDNLMAQVITPLVGEDVAKVPLVRRLWFESYSATMVEIKQRVSGTPDGAPRKLTQPELISRRKAVQAKVSGLKLTGELDVSDELINIFENMAATQTIRYVGLEKSTKRELGIEGITADPHIVKEGQFLKEVPGKAEQEVDTSTDLRVELALQRLGLAADMGGVLSFAQHEEMRLALRDASLETPPPGYAKVSIHQLRRAHKEFWNQLSLRSEGKVAAVGGVRPLDALVPQVIASRQFEACLKYLPQLPSVGARDASNPSKNTAETGKPAKLSRSERKRKQIEKAVEAARVDVRAKFPRQRPGG